MFRDMLEEIEWRVPGRRVLVFTGCAFLAAGLFGFGSLYERDHLSADLRRTLLLAVAPNASEVVLSASLKQARTHLHTWRDHQEYNKLQHIVKANAAAQRSEVRLGGQLKRAQVELDSEIHTQKLMIVTERAYLNSHEQMPAGLAADLAGEQLRRERVRDQEQQEDDGAWLELLQERLDARVQMQQLRADLGLATPAPQP